MGVLFATQKLTKTSQAINEPYTRGQLIKKKGRI